MFVPCGFRPNNSAFTSQRMVAEDYKHPASDSMQAERVKQIPRIDALEDLVGMLGVGDIRQLRGCEGAARED